MYVLYIYLLYLYILYLIIYIYKTSSCFLSLLRTSCIHEVLSPLNTSVSISPNQGHFATYSPYNPPILIQHHHPIHRPVHLPTPAPFKSHQLSQQLFFLSGTLSLLETYTAVVKSLQPRPVWNCSPLSLPFMSSTVLLLMSVTVLKNTGLTLQKDDH